MNLSVEEFMERVECDPNSGCQLWSGAPGAGGYGVCKYDGRNQKAHRVSWALHHGEMPPPEIKICHKCDTPPCVNETHLFVGTQAENVADMVAKGRQRGCQRFGTANPMAALDEAVVLEIRRVLSLGGIPQRRLAERYGVSYMTISRIANYQTWPHVRLDQFPEARSAA